MGEIICLGFALKCCNKKNVGGKVNKFGKIKCWLLLKLGDGEHGIYDAI